MIWLVLLGFIVGVVAGSFSPITLPMQYVRYLSVSLLACLDSVFGGIRASLEDKFDNVIFITGFFTNALLAGILVYLGDRLGFELYLAAIVAFGVRLFQNLAIIRRHLLKQFYPDRRDDNG